MKRRKDKLNGFFIGLFVGSIAAGTTAMLYAPMSGKKLRKTIARKKDDMVEDLNEYIETGRGYIEDTRKKATDILQQAKSKISHQA